MRPFTAKYPGESEPRPRTNVSVLPDDWLLTFQPVFLIRHPALTFPSLIRALNDTRGFDVSERFIREACALRYVRSLYEWFVVQSSAVDSQNEASDGGRLNMNSDHQTPLQPYILDADDLQNSKSAVQKLCLALQFEPKDVQYEWTQEVVNSHNPNPASLHEQNTVARFMSSLRTSTGILKGKDAVGLNLDQETRKWDREFGEGVGRVIRTWVDNNMEDYEWLRSRRVTGN